MRWSGQMNESEWRGGVGKYTSARSKEIGFAIFVEVFTVVAPRHQQSYKSALPTLSLWANSDQTKYNESLKLYVKNLIICTVFKQYLSQ